MRQYRTATVKNIRPAGFRKVVDLSVTKNRTFVTGNNIVVHNCNSTQPALRAFIEEFSKNCRFILTCNFKNRIIEPLHSRCSMYDFGIPRQERPMVAAKFFSRLTGILDAESVTYDEKVLVALIERHFPDWRRVLNECQRHAISDGTIGSNALASVGDKGIGDLVRYMKAKDFTKMRGWVADSSALESTEVYRTLYDTLTGYLTPQSVPSIILILAQYQYYDAFVSDHQLNLVACLTEIMTTAEWK